MSGLRYGSLFSGVGGLDLAVEAVFGATCAWHSEVDPNASKVLAHRWPDVPNHGDITRIDWAGVEPVDILCGGFPCQDISSAGRGAGIKEGTRSGLWYRYADAVRVLRPRFVFVENVSALLVRGLDIVIGDLASLGYVGSWCRVHASDVGAPHKRARIFLLAWPAADADDGGRGGRAPGDEPAMGGRDRLPAVGCEGIGVAAGSAGPAAGPVGPLLPTPVANDSGNTPEDHLRKTPGREVVTSLAILVGNGLIASGGRLLPTPTTAPSTGNGHARHLGGEVASLLPTPRTSDTNGPGVHGDGGLDLRTAVTLLPTPTAMDSAGSRGHHFDGTPYGPTSGTTLTDTARTDWGPYEPAIRRWETLTRPAPAPTDTKGRLSPELPEWMMGFPEAWITGHLGRTAALRAAGNAVVWQQAATAARMLLARTVEPVS